METLHEIAKSAAKRLQKKDDGSWRLTRRDAEALRAELTCSYASDELYSAVRSLIALAAHLEEQGSRQSARALMRLASSAYPALKSMGDRLGHGLQDRAQHVRGRFDLFCNSSQPRVAHRYGARAPKGSMRLQDLITRDVIR